MHALEHGGAAESANLQTIVDWITPHVKHLFDEPGDPRAHLTAAVRANALASAERAAPREPHAAGPHRPRARAPSSPAVYDLETGVVTFLDKE